MGEERQGSDGQGKRGYGRLSAACKLYKASVEPGPDLTALRLLYTAPLDRVWDRPRPGWKARPRLLHLGL